MLAAMLAASKIVNEVRFIVEKLLESSSQRVQLSPARTTIYKLQSLGQVLAPACPASSFARDMPVSHIELAEHKYIRFQRFAAIVYETTINYQVSWGRKPHMGKGNFIQ